MGRNLGHLGWQNRPALLLTEQKKLLEFFFHSSANKPPRTPFAGAGAHHPRHTAAHLVEIGVDIRVPGRYWQHPAGHAEKDISRMLKVAVKELEYDTVCTVQYHPKPRIDTPPSVWAVPTRSALPASAPMIISKSGALERRDFQRVHIRPIIEFHRWYVKGDEQYVQSCQHCRGDTEGCATPSVACGGGGRTMV